MSPRPVNATDTDIIAMLRDGHSNTRINRELHVDKARVSRIRTQLGLPQHARAGQTRSLEQKWADNTRPTDDGHLEWTGEHAKASGTPIMRHKQGFYSPAALAFEIKHGREPQGYVKAHCGRAHCIAPDHVSDAAGRRQTRLEERARRGMTEIAATCRYGHDLSEHAKFEPDGTLYCGQCNTLNKQVRRDPSLPRRTRPRPATPGESFRLHTEPVDGGHLRWTGYVAHGVPTVCHAGSAYSAYRISFRLHHGREPVGRAMPTCGKDGCLAGDHLADRPMREANRRADKAYAAIFGGAS
ncbi:hypothetical protein [Streptomyces typhae]|uniref:hypothetical protein n=1 Tax=Streptomyces typhae TaxID=2681492 RepID=UPI0012F6D711|nr:hypothetical protein [Streptomyces typhae]